MDHKILDAHEEIRKLKEDWEVLTAPGLDGQYWQLPRQELLGKIEDLYTKVARMTEIRNFAGKWVIVLETGDWRPYYTEALTETAQGEA